MNVGLFYCIALIQRNNTCIGQKYFYSFKQPLKKMNVKMCDIAFSKKTQCDFYHIRKFIYDCQFVGFLIFGNIPGFSIKLFLTTDSIRKFLLFGNSGSYLKKKKIR